MVLNNIFDEVIVHIEQRFKTTGEFSLVELLNQKLFHAYEKIKKIPMKAFSTLDGLKCKLKSAHAADFAKQASSIQEVTEIVQELELNQVLAEVTKLLCLILIIPSTFASFESLSSSVKSVNNYMRCFQSEERWSNFVFISMNKNLLKMKVECTVDNFCKWLMILPKRNKKLIGLVGFYGISTIMGYSMPNPVYTYKICKLILLITFLNEPELRFFAHS